MARQCPQKDAAVAAGLSTYCTGQECVRGHYGPRRVVGSGCLDCEREDRVRWATSEKFRASVGLPEPTRPMPQACECCGGPPVSGYLRLSLDHDHETGEFRGWLCNHCNLGIGRLGDTVASLERALAYLKRGR